MQHNHEQFAVDMIAIKPILSSSALDNRGTILQFLQRRAVAYTRLVLKWKPSHSNKGKVKSWLSETKTVFVSTFVCTLLFVSIPIYQIDLLIQLFIYFFFSTFTIKPQRHYPDILQEVGTRNHTTIGIVNCMLLPPNMSSGVSRGFTF